MWNHNAEINRRMRTTSARFLLISKQEMQEHNKMLSSLSAAIQVSERARTAASVSFEVGSGGTHKNGGRIADRFSAAASDRKQSIRAAATPYGTQFLSAGISLPSQNPRRQEVSHEPMGIRADSHTRFT